ncbi:MAG: P83/100 family protein [Spirochaetales bacterium]
MWHTGIMKWFHVCSVLLVATLISAQELRVDTTELQTALREGIEFENYEGVPEKIETLDQIRGIGATLAGSEGRASTGKYTIIHAVDPSVPTGLDADLFILEPRASVDHIRNLRWILGSYLETQYGYGRADSDLLAYFITIYNAVYRKNLAYFTERYKPIVLSYLDPEKVGLALSYREWPGRTQIVIPLSGPRKEGILSIETASLTEKPVVEELRKEEDRGIPLRKEMVDLKERQLKEEERQIEEEKKALQIERERLASSPQPEASPSPSEGSTKTPAIASIPRSTGTEETRSDRALEEKSSPEPSGAILSGPPEDKQTETVSAEQKIQPSPQEKPDRTETGSSIESIVRKEEELKGREKLLEEKQRALREERVAIAKDQQELLEQKALKALKTVPFLFMEDDHPRLVLVEEGSGEIKRRSPEYPLALPMYEPFGGGYLVLLPRSNSGARLVLLDPADLRVLVSAREEIAREGMVRVHGSYCFAVLKEGNDWYVGKYDTTLALLARSRLAVHPRTDLSIHGENLYVQTPSGEVVVLNLELSSP